MSPLSHAKYQHSTQLTYHPSRSFNPVIAATALLIAGVANAATVSQDDIKSLIAEARQNGVVPVQINLAMTSLQQIQNDLGGVKTAMANREAALVSELGAKTLNSGRWRNGVGQMGLYVNEDGLKILQGSSNAVSFTRGEKWHKNTNLDGSDGGLAKIETVLNKQGYVDVVVTTNVEGLQHHMTKNGVVTFSAPGKTQLDVSALVQPLLKRTPVGAVTFNANATATLNGAAFNPQVTMRLNREGVLALAASDSVRHMAPVGFKDTRPVQVDNDALARAQTDGKADVLITLRNPYAGGTQSVANFTSLKQSHKRAITDLLADRGVKSPLTQEVPEFGVFRVTLTSNELKALIQSNDPRLMAVELKKAMATPQLVTSTTTMNMPSAWNIGLRAAGQNIIVMDTGVQSNHLFFRNANGTSRVSLEACFGSSDTAYDKASKTYYSVQSVCPGGAGSVIGVPGAAAPVPNCSSVFSGYCNHGTHVAGIAAGRQNASLWNPYGSGVFQGVAPDANIIAVQIFSYDTKRKYTPVANNSDMIAAMQAIAGAMTIGTQNNPYVLNLSLGGGAYKSSCDSVSPSITNAIRTLVSNGVPVIAATGNDRGQSDYTDGNIGWPACIAGVIKVGATSNDGVGTTISSFTNLPDMSGFAGEAVYMVPGGDYGKYGNTYIWSSVPDFASSGANGNGMSYMAGTSQATPHVSGLYAVYKAAVPGTTVRGATAWLQQYAGIQLTPVCSGQNCQPYYRLRLP